VTKDKFKNPPKLAEWILSCVYPDRGDFTSVGDFREEYLETYQSSGPFKANLWYWMQIAKSIPSCVRNKSHWGIILFNNYLKTAFRNIKRHKGYSFINITGLALGLASCFLVTGLIIYELSYDNFHENSANIYRVNQDYTRRGRQFYETWTNHKLMQVLINDYPEIIHATRINRADSSLVSNGEKSFYERIITVDNAFFQMFTFPFIKGDKRTALTEPNSIVITEEIASKYFPDEEPMGKLLKIDNEYDYLITGVIKNIPPNSRFQFNMAVPQKKATHDLPWSAMSTITYIQLIPEVTADEFNRKIGDFIQNQIVEEDLQIQLFLEPLEELHLSRYAGSLRQTLYMYSICALAILLIACVNFINLSTACSAGRAKEIGIRKVVGAFRNNVVFQFLGESMLLSFISLFAALVLAGLLFPVFTNLINMNRPSFTFLSLMTPEVILVMTSVAIFTGFAAGCYPAILLSGFSPVKIIKGHLSIGSKGFALRKILVVAQFSFSIFLIIGTVVIFNQLSFMKNKEIGYNKEQIVTIRLRKGSEKFYPRFKNQLLMDSRIIKVGGISTQLPYFWECSNKNDWEGKDPDQHVVVGNSHIDYDFLETLGIELVEGRNFSRDFSTDANSFVVNETLANVMGMESAIGKRLTFVGQTGNIIGVMKDFIFWPLDSKTKPLAFMLGPDKVRFVSIRIQKENIASTLGFIEKTWKHTVPMFPFIYSFLDEDYGESFQEEESVGRLLTTFAFISIFISCLGLLGLATYTAQQRTKEIGIRKVLGASISQITMMLSHEFTKWVGIANVIAFPVAYFVLSRWLQNFAYRTTLSLWVFILSALLGFVLAMLTVSFQAIKAATANPVESLRYE
jgi:putative ABC transport system permease protein